tara:strand:+ start:834 stop:989 length:156 start_codon:yes stop_codon:yes gene_type:complete
MKKGDWTMALDLTEAFAHPLTELKEATAASSFDTEAFQQDANNIEGISLIT